MRKIPLKKIPPEKYDQKYLLSTYVEGFEEFKEKKMSFRIEKILNLLELEKDFNLLDVGMGRGDLLYHCAKKGVKITGIDYSKDSVEIARQTLSDFPEANILLGDARKIPFPANSFERVCASDVLEHLDREDGQIMLRELYRVLKPNGFLLIHTAPNSLFFKYIYPIVKSLKLIKKRHLEEIDRHLKISKEVHAFEYNLFSLRRAAKESGLSNAKIWIDEDVLRSRKYIYTKELNKNPLVNLAAFLGKFTPLRVLLGNDLYLKYYKSTNDG